MLQHHKFYNYSHLFVIQRYSTFQLNVQTSYFNSQRFTQKTCNINFLTQIQYSCMIQWGTQPNHEFVNRRSKLPSNS